MATVPANYPICPRRRADYVLSLQFKDSEGDPINLTSWQVHAQLWEKTRNSKIADFDVNVINAATGRVDLKLDYDITEDLPDAAYYDVMLINASALREYYLEGDVNVVQGYTEVP